MHIAKTFSFGLLVSTVCMAGTCADSLYRGFDTRLNVALVGRLPSGKEQVVGFEIVRGTPIVAFPHRLLRIDKRKQFSLFVEQEIKALAVTQSGHLFVQQLPETGSGLLTVAAVDTQFEPDRKLNGRVRGNLYNSGSPVFLEIDQKDAVLDFIARNSRGDPLPLASMEGHLRAASWNKNGLAAVVDQSLYLWRAGGAEFFRLGTDVGLGAARDACMVGPTRAIAALQNSVVLITEQTATPIVLMHARCRWDSGVLYLLDEVGGLIWGIRGVDRIGTISSNRQHAATLAADKNSNSSQPLLEAARLVGCDEASKLTGSAAPNQPSGREMQTGNAPRTAEEFVNLGTTEIDTGDYTSAISNFSRALQLDRTNNAARAGLERAKRAMQAEADITNSRK